MFKIRFVAALVGISLAIGGVAAALPPKKIVIEKHSNLGAAQRFSQQAWDRVTAAEKAKEWDAQGHAQKAKELLEQANNELKLALDAAPKSAR